ncbi:MAG: right-handed parallel beta-helix repeat-containing protein [Treponema sp.]|jgi:hypothetical protein|nr:right-handed parallel beta-helix repeat-containing protein [Treponema sp.]
MTQNDNRTLFFRVTGTGRFFRPCFAALLVLALTTCSNYNLSLKDFFGDPDRDLEDFGPVPAGSISRFLVGNDTEWDDALFDIQNGGNNKNYVITLTGDFGIPSGSTFGTVTGVTVSLRGKKTLSLNTAGNLLDLTGNQTLILWDATLQGDLPSNPNSLVYLNGGTFFMKSGTISDNTATASSGGGVYVEGGGGFTMSGGTIRNTAANYNGGGVAVSGIGSSFTMSGGTIRNTTASVGGGVFVTGGGDFAMSGGIISDNHAIVTGHGGGVYVTSSSSFTMSGGTISGNTAVSGGGVYFSSSSGNFTMSGGTISGNHATGLSSSGGGVSFSSASPSTFTMNSGTISDNHATGVSSSGGGVYVSGSGGFTMYSGTISGNDATVSGGGVSVAAGDFTMSD